jgi:uncharacterized membrane protein
LLIFSYRVLKSSAYSKSTKFLLSHFIPYSQIAFAVLFGTKFFKMIHITEDTAQNPDLIQNQLLASFPTLTAAMLFLHIALINLMYLSGIPYKDRIVTKALLTAESNAC